MPRKGQMIKTIKRAPVKPTAPTPRHADALEHNGLMRYMREHLEWLQVTGYSASTARARHQAIRKFIAWIDERGIDDPRQITRPMIERYQRHLFYARKDNGEPLSVGIQLQYLAAIKLWFKWLTRARHILANPASELELPRSPKALPARILSSAEVQTLLNEAEPANASGVRDRALLELLYASGVRRSEAASLGVYDVDSKRGVLWVRHGKGGHQRVVPLGERASAWISRYLRQARPELLAGADTDAGQALFLTDYGEPMSAGQVATKVSRYLRIAGLTQKQGQGGSTHLLRHACATHMLEGGADIRFIQAMLGHANLETTEIYTHVSIDKLIEVHRATHPSRLERRQPKHVDAPSADSAGDGRAASATGSKPGAARRATMQGQPGI